MFIGIKTSAKILKEKHQIALKRAIIYLHAWHLVTNSEDTPRYFLQYVKLVAAILQVLEQFENVGLRLDPV